MTAYKIRAVDSLEYADEIVEFCRRFRDYMVPVKPDDIQECWIAFLDEAPVGFAALMPSQNWPLAGYLARCGVLPEHRGNNLQRRLIRAREAAARRHGWHWLVTDTYCNPHSVNNLIACGYTTFYPKKPWGLHKETAVYWCKRIGPPDAKSVTPQ
jgi:GNAT superfamily N-acetyltransferase